MKKFKISVLLAALSLSGCTANLPSSTSNTPSSPPYDTVFNHSETQSSDESILDKLNLSFKTADFKLNEKASTGKIEFKGYKVLPYPYKNPYTTIAFVLTLQSDPMREYTEQAVTEENKTLYYMDKDNTILEIRSTWQEFEFCGIKLSTQKQDNPYKEDLICESLFKYGFEFFFGNNEYPSTTGSFNEYYKNLTVYFDSRFNKRDIFQHQSLSHL